MAKRTTPRQKRRSTRKHRLSNASLSNRSQLARDRALHALAAMRTDPRISLAHAAKLQGVKSKTIKKYFPSALKKANGKFRATKSDRYTATLYVPSTDGQRVPVQTRGSRERRQLSNYLRDVGRYMRGKRDALSRWEGKKIGDVVLGTDGRTLKAIEPALSDFSLYRSLNGGAD